MRKVFACSVFALVILPASASYAVTPGQCGSGSGSGSNCRGTTVAGNSDSCSGDSGGDDSCDSGDDSSDDSSCDSSDDSSSCDSGDSGGDCSGGGDGGDCSVAGRHDSHGRHGLATGLAWASLPIPLALVLRRRARTKGPR